MTALEKERNGKTIHVSVGAIIRDKEGRLLLVDRAVFPPGLACIAGHVDEGEKPEEAITREIGEEANLAVKKLNLLLHDFIEWNECSKGVKGHEWYVFEAECAGTPEKNDRESKSISHYSIEEIRKLEAEEKLELVWKHLLKELEII